MVWVPTDSSAAVMIVALLVIAVIAIRIRTPIDPGRAWRLAAYLIIPGLIYCLSYASTAQLSQWIDLFHRGESIGPASDYLRGKVPYRDVFALHGMLEDGLLDAWLMHLFGRSLDVAVARTVILGAFLPVSLWYLGIAIFRSIPPALLVVAMGSWTTAENIEFFQVRRWLFCGSRSVWEAGSRRIGAAFSPQWRCFSATRSACTRSSVRWRRWCCCARREGASPLRWACSSVPAPFVVYLAWRGALDDS